MSHPTPAHALIRQAAEQLAEQVRPVLSSHGAARVHAEVAGLPVRTPEPDDHPATCHALAQLLGVVGDLTQSVYLAAPLDSRARTELGTAWRALVTARLDVDEAAGARLTAFDGQV